MAFENAEWDELLARMERDVAARQARASEIAADEAVWAEVERRLARYGRILLYRRSDLKPQDVDDACQNVLLKLQSVDTLRRMRASRSPGGYLITMLRNAGSDLARRVRREAQLTPGAMKDGERHATTHHRSADELKSLLERVDDLDPATRALLRLRYVEGESIGGIAKSLGLTYSAAAVRLFRAIRRLRGT